MNVKHYMMFKQLNIVNFSYTQANMQHAITTGSITQKGSYKNKEHSIVQITHSQYTLSHVPCAVNKTSYPPKSYLPDDLLFHVHLVSAHY